MTSTKRLEIVIEWDEWFLLPVTHASQDYGLDIRIKTERSVMRNDGGGESADEWKSSILYLRTWVCVGDRKLGYKVRRKIAPQLPRLSLQRSM